MAIQLVILCFFSPSVSIVPILCPLSAGHSCPIKPSPASYSQPTFRSSIEFVQFSISIFTATEILIYDYKEMNWELKFRKENLKACENIKKGNSVCQPCIKWGNAKGIFKHWYNGITPWLLPWFRNPCNRPLVDPVLCLCWKMLESKFGPVARWLASCSAGLEA